MVHRLAGVAQLVEQLIRNQQVTRSSRVAGSKFLRQFSILIRFASGDRLLDHIGSQEGGLSRRCKRVSENRRGQRRGRSGRPGAFTA